jgi:glutathione S-transferase
LEAEKKVFFKGLRFQLHHCETFLSTNAFFGGKVRHLVTCFQSLKPCVGSCQEPHMGDFGLFHPIDLATSVEPTALANHPEISAWMERMSELPAVEKYLAERADPTPV